jgi:hypothetical protein
MDRKFGDSELHHFQLLATEIVSRMFRPTVGQPDCSTGCPGDGLETNGCGFSCSRAILAEVRTEGIVSKGADAPYAPGNRGLWVFVVFSVILPEAVACWISELS